MHVSKPQTIAKDLFPVLECICTSCHYSEGTYVSVKPVVEKWWCKKHNVRADAVCADYVPDAKYRSMWGDPR